LFGKEVRSGADCTAARPMENYCMLSQRMAHWFVRYTLTGQWDHRRFQKVWPRAVGGSECVVVKDAGHLPPMHRTEEFQ
jgi:hypothetical protein